MGGDLEETGVRRVSYQGFGLHFFCLLCGKIGQENLRPGKKKKGKKFEEETLVIAIGEFKIGRGFFLVPFFT